MSGSAHFSKIGGKLRDGTGDFPAGFQEDSESKSHCVTHFVGFKDDRYWAARKVFGNPEYIHRGWDLRAQREIAEGDVVVFADGPHDQEPRRQSFSDLTEPTP